MSLGSGWVLDLRAGERIAPDDEEALIALTEQEPDPGAAYLLQVVPVDAGDRILAAPRPAWSPRLIARDRSATPRHARRTTVRIQARQPLVGAGPQPGRSGDGLAWPPRPPGLPALFGGAAPEPPPVPDGAPVLSTIVISRDDDAVIERAVESVLGQRCPVPFEVILVTSGSGREGAIVRERFPEVQVIEFDHPALPGEARNAGVRAARGRYVSFPGSHIELPPGSLAARVAAHRLGYAMVTGTMLNGTETVAGWASYFLDNSTVLPGRPSGPLTRAPIRCSYRRDALLHIGGFPEDMRAGEDTVVNHRLFDLGYGAYRARELTLRHHSPCRTPARLLRHHFTRGRARGRILFDGAVERGEWATLARFIVFGPSIRLRRTWRGVHAWGPESVGRFRRVLPLIGLAVISAWAGCCCELARLSWRALVPSRRVGLG